MVFNEREAIRFRLEKISEEKKILFQRDRELDKEYNFYIQRLRELDQKGLGSTTDLTHGQPAEYAPEPETREEPQEPGMKKKYNGNLRQYDFDALKRGLSNFKKKRTETREIQEDRSKFRLDPNDRRRRGKQYNLQEVAELVEDILKAHGEPMEIHTLRDALAEKGYKWKHFLPTLPNIMKHSKRIQKPYRGHVAYASNDQEKQASESNKSASEEWLEANVREAAGEIPDSVLSGKNKE